MDARSQSGRTESELEAENRELRAQLGQARDHERFIESILENLPAMVFVKDAADLRFVRFNAAGEALLGFSRADLLGKSDFDFFPAEEARHFVEKDRQVLAGRVVLDIPEEPIHTHHGLRHLHTKKIPILDDDGDPLYLLGISEDVTELKASGEALRARTEELETARALLVQNEQRLRVLLQHFPGVVWTTDARLLLRSVDGAGAQGLGLNARIGYSVGECLPAGPDDNVEIGRAHV